MVMWGGPIQSSTHLMEVRCHKIMKKITQKYLRMHVKVFVLIHQVMMEFLASTKQAAAFRC